MNTTQRSVVVCCVILTAMMFVMGYEYSRRYFPDAVHIPDNDIIASVAAEKMEPTPVRQNNSISTLVHSFVENDTSPLVNALVKQNKTSALAQALVEQGKTSTLIKALLKQNKPSKLVQVLVKENTIWKAVRSRVWRDTIDPCTMSFPVKPLPLNGYIVYDCDGQHEEDCGGWSDRISGMYSAYVISAILNKHFLIKYTRSGNLTDYLIPNSFDWRYNPTILEGKTWGYQSLVIKTPDFIKKCNLTELRSFFSKDVNFLRVNWDYTQHFRKFRGLQSVIPWLTNLQFADIYSKFFHTLFKPTPMVNGTVNGIVKNAPKLACAHIRMGGSKTIPGDDKHTDKAQLKYIWDQLKKLEKENYKIFVATDAQFVRQRARDLFPELMEVEGRIIHIDWKNSGSNLDEGYRKVVFDFFVLTKCDVLILTRSGFGSLASYLNTKVKQLYCATPYELVPCSRYTVNDFYPDQILSPY